MFVGVGASRVEIYSKELKRSSIYNFIDEIDAIGRARGKSNFTGSNDEREYLNQLLTEMDGFELTQMLLSSQQQIEPMY